MIFKTFSAKKMEKELAVLAQITTIYVNRKKDLSVFVKKNADFFDEN
jgi:hypothetical protein